jgi:hypothetical protein
MICQIYRHKIDNVYNSKKFLSPHYYLFIISLFNIHIETKNVSNYKCKKHKHETRTCDFHELEKSFRGKECPYKQANGKCMFPNNTYNFSYQHFNVIPACNFHTSLQNIKKLLSKEKIFFTDVKCRSHTRKTIILNSLNMRKTFIGK